MAPVRKKKKTTREGKPAKKALNGKLARLLLDHPLNEVINSSYAEYGKYVIEDRAVPSFQDGLKPSQRRALWALYYAKGSRPDKGFIKSSTVEGAAMEYHPHGGTYGTIANMIEGTTCPLIMGSGNFGSFSKLNTPPAAPRYTEVKMSHFTMECLFNKRFEKVFPTVPSYTGESFEPVWLPAQLPLILTLGASGIAVGVMTNIPAFTVESVFKAISFAFSKGKIPSVAYLVKTLEFATPYGGKMTSSEQDVEQLIRTGVGSIEWICDYAIKGKALHIHGIPPGWSADSRLDTIRKLPAVASVDDISSEKEIDIRVTFKRASEDALHVEMQKVKKLLTSKIHYKCNITERSKVEDELVPTTLAKFRSVSIVGLFKEWMAFRIHIEKMALRQEHKELGKDLSHQKLMKLAVLNLDVIFQLLKKKGIDKVTELSKKLRITEDQSRTIWGIAVGRLDRLSEVEIDDKIKALVKRRKTVKALFKVPMSSISTELKNSKHLMAAATAIRD